MFHALQALAQDPTALSALSAPGRLAFDTMKGAVEEALHAPLESLTGLAAPVAADVLQQVGDLVAAVPMVGQFAAVAMKILDVLLNAGDANRRTLDTVSAGWVARLQPRGSGSVLGEGRVVPADVFVHGFRFADAFETGAAAEGVRRESGGRASLSPDHKYNPKTNGWVVGAEQYPSALGQALAVLTEGAPVDESAVDFGYLARMVQAIGPWQPTEQLARVMGASATYPTDAGSWRQMVGKNYEVCCESIPMPGVPVRRRAQFTALRREIARAWRRPGDGGAALWLVYLDLLAAEYRAGHLTPDGSITALGLIPRIFLGGHAPFWQPLWGFETQRGPYMTTRQADQIRDLVAQWGDAVAPSYSAGKAKIQAFRAADLRVSGVAPTAIYLDHHATTPCDPRVVEAMLPAFSAAFGNPGSRHRFGRDAEAAVEQAREQLASVIGAEPGEVVFTSGATESDNLALRGALGWSRQRGGHLITCATEHNAVLKVAEQLRGEGFRCTVLPVDGDGLVDVDAIGRVITPGEPTVVSVMAANNEIGTLQPIAAIGRLCRERGAVFHCDATQAIGKIPFDVAALGVDLASISAHKMYGPKGVGALYVRRGVCLCPGIVGGGQEQGLRAGTSNVHGIVGLGAAAALAQEEIGEEAERLAALRDELLDRLVAGLGDRVRVNGSVRHRLPGNLSVCIAGVDGRELVRALDGQGVAVSTGSACSRGITPSHVLRAIGRTEREAWEAIRIGLGRWTTGHEIRAANEVIVAVVRGLDAGREGE
jgi:cysteine desulfurase